MRSVSAAEGVEGRQRVAVRGVEPEHGAVVPIGRGSVEVPRRVGDERGGRVRPVRTVESVEGRHCVVVGGVELEDGAEGFGAVVFAARGCSIEVARGIGDERSSRFR